MATLRAYAVGSAFSTRDADGTDDFGWRRVDFASDDYDYRRPTPANGRDGNGNPRRRPAAVRTRRDPSAIRTPEQIRAAGRRNCS